MKIIRIFALFAVISAACLASPAARAEPKPWIWSWYESHWDHLDFIPYLENGTDPHNSQWDKNPWKPTDWIVQRKSEFSLIRGFYNARVLQDQYTRQDGTPVVVVGPGFYMLGGQDKRRVTKLIDTIWHVTDSKPDGIFMLEDWKTGQDVGIYTKYGLQIQ